MHQHALSLPRPRILQSLPNHVLCPCRTCQHPLYCTARSNDPDFDRGFEEEETGREEGSVRTKTRRHIIYIVPSVTYIVSNDAIVINSEYGKFKVTEGGHTGSGTPEQGVVRVEHVLASGRLSATTVSECNPRNGAIVPPHFQRLDVHACMYMPKHRPPSTDVRLARVRMEIDRQTRRTEAVNEHGPCTTASRRRLSGRAAGNGARGSRG